MTDWIWVWSPPTVAFLFETGISFALMRASSVLLACTTESERGRSPYNSTACA
ncbi:MAG: hypothetical protein JGK17_29590 [Microcoleus sp. PH2017_10_PVI_O_A]|uniref:hypothetical protein n=1 Tax=unclassified Microcoleus TaxID=2642155 RepID=UPI001D1B384B|nr:MULTISPECIES: hypothetical protein [unclassified Microcoleus]MCC3409631.1 hypothetical protein [Microcoleus sp. PH2017_10_PVI_O_A]MCC3463886.1 hypothetical protein [Microcoleus sp. PH2017_11_PCY_U_A]MCC3482232.1 hypothetical protein [Microcoleus sp. PH2017_12_PCY_D_A]MCC3531989.1 hypothetical protein [Microcoleus sp. PH2017_21_RUC_O_A]MCC3544404.1 hypothetical protein [Microcoleus sp. PH2017_22_RUC_O_B]